MKIIDSFIFYNELDLLFYRLSILDPSIDKCIVVESTHTFSGKPKPLFYNENKAMFEKFNHKIIHIIVDNVPYIFPTIDYNKNQQWENEYHQRNAIKRGLDTIISDLTTDDILLTSDVDEIPNPSVLISAKENQLSYDKTTLNRLALDMYYYNLRYRIGSGSNWHGIKLLTIGAYNTHYLSFQQMRTYEHSHMVPIIPKGGWHLSYFGDIEFIKNKIRGYAHQEYNNDQYLNDKKLTEDIKNGKNLLNNTDLQYIPINENTNLPNQYDLYLQKYL